MKKQVIRNKKTKKPNNMTTSLQKKTRSEKYLSFFNRLRPRVVPVPACGSCPGVFRRGHPLPFWASRENFSRSGPKIIHKKGNSLRGHQAESSK